MPVITMRLAMTWPGCVIGNSMNPKGLPWSPGDLPSDMREFRRATVGKHVIVGWHTFSFMGPLPDREHVVITRNHGIEVTDANATPMESSMDALWFVQRQKVKEVCVIGGAYVYESFLPHADRILVTLVQTDLPGDTHFSLPSEEHWVLNWEKSDVLFRYRDIRDKHKTSWLVYELRNPRRNNALI